ncbi:MAG: GntR family transcriptional regulator [Reyranellaceae bacterium]
MAVSQPSRERKTAQRAKPATSLVEMAYKELEKQIVTTQLAPGDWITESQIGARLGISRTPVREAVQRLARAKLVEIEPRRGLRITAINVFDQLTLLRFRRVVEHFITREVAKRAADADRRALLALAEEMERGSNAGNYAEHYRIDLEYKLLLLKCVRNEYAATAIEPLWAASRRFAWVNRHNRDIPKVGKLTANLMRAIAGGDLRKTAAATTAFIDSLEALARRKLKEDDQG